MENIIFHKQHSKIIKFFAISMFLSVFKFNFSNDKTEILNDPKKSMYFRNNLFLFLIAYHIFNIKISVLETLLSSKDT